MNITYCLCLELLRFRKFSWLLLLISKCLVKMPLVKLPTYQIFSWWNVIFSIEKIYRSESDILQLINKQTFSDAKPNKTYIFFLCFLSNLSGKIILCDTFFLSNLLKLFFFPGTFVQNQCNYLSFSKQVCPHFYGFIV